MKLLRARKATFVHAAPCWLPPFSCADADVAQSKSASTSMGRLVFEIMSDQFL
jgi:hypothetical protein